jgi:hypothetical protein
MLFGNTTAAGAKISTGAVAAPTVRSSGNATAGVAAGTDLVEALAAEVGVLLGDES